MAASVLEFRSVTKRFGRINAVDHMTFSVRRGEIFTLLGPSGCGKTTTLRLVAGLEEPDGGEISIDGKLVASASAGVFMPPEKRHLGMVFQSYAIWPHLSVFENVAFPLRVRHAPAETVASRVERALDLVGLAGFAERGATQLSGGQQQRVALARALVYEPAILLLDEPLSHLDAKLREQMRVEIRALQRKLGLTILYVTHDQAEAMTLSDQIAVVRGGRFEQIGSPEEVYERPANAFVAEFLGRTVIFEGRVVKNHSGLWIEFSHRARTLVPSVSAEGLADGDDVRVTTRPEDIEILDDGELSTNQVRGRIEQVVYLGDRLEYHVRAQARSFVLAAPKKTRYRAGDAVRLGLDPSRLDIRRSG
ncbi:MAG TPA: ABC transporter ATP-binding protein [Candidatus Eisenbacteria bacterium]|nr:ABC transporter ATP-binding protein [Candidatus Eisenbacteria bacterium]